MGVSKWAFQSWRFKVGLQSERFRRGVSKYAFQNVGNKVRGLTWVLQRMRFKTVGVSTWAFQTSAFQNGRFKVGVLIGRFQRGASKLAFQSAYFNLGVSNKAFAVGVYMGCYKMSASDWAFQSGRFKLSALKSALQSGRFKVAVSK